MSDRPDGSPTAVDVVLRPEWAAIAGVDKNLGGTDTGIAFNGSLVVAYVVPAGKELTIITTTSFVNAGFVADAGLPQHGLFELLVAGTDVVIRGIEGGHCDNYSKPIVATAGQLVQFAIWNKSPQNTNIGVFAFGYERDV